MNRQTLAKAILLCVIVPSATFNFVKIPPSSLRPASSHFRSVSPSLLSAEAASPPTSASVPWNDSRGQKSGSSFLPQDAIDRAAGGNPIEKLKLQKDATSAWSDIYSYAEMIRSGKTEWKDLDDKDIDSRLKFAGLLHRRKRAAGTFMMRLKVPNGIVTSDQMRFYAKSVEKYKQGDVLGDALGVVDITTRQNIQLRGVTIEDAPDIIDGLHARNQTSFQSALDNVRNVVGSPLAGIDPHELVDTRPLCEAVNDLITLDVETGLRGNPKWGNLGRKFNICISGSRDDFAHTHINDIGFIPVAHSETGEMGFNVVLGGYMSIKRVAESVHPEIWVPADRNSVIAVCEAILRIFRDEGGRKDRQKARLMWLVEEYGLDEFTKYVKKEIDSYGRGVNVQNKQPEPKTEFSRRDSLDLVEQKQPGLYRVGVHVPVGRLSATECNELADVADKYSSGEIRLTVEQNALLPNVKESDLSALREEDIWKGRLSLKEKLGNIEANIVACTGAQHCGVAIIETKANAVDYAKKLEKLVKVDKPLRIHWTGCPNSCAQVQAADIGLMGAPARKLDPTTGKKVAAPGVTIFVGGKIGENPFLATEPYKKNVLVDDEFLLPELVDIVCEKFGGKRIKTAAS